MRVSSTKKNITTDECIIARTELDRHYIRRMALVFVRGYFLYSTRDNYEEA